MANYQNFTSDSVAIFKSDFTQAFSKARPLNLAVALNSKVMTHPLEDGSQVSDHIIKELTQLEISLLLSSSDYLSVYQDIKNAYEKNELFSIQTKTDIFNDMVIQKIPQTQTPNLYNALQINLSFIEFRKVKAIVRSGIGTPRKAKDSNTANTGKQQGTQKPYNSTLSKVIK